MIVPATIISSKIVIIDDIPSNNILNAKKYSFEDYKITNNDTAKAKQTNHISKLIYEEMANKIVQSPK